MNAEANKALVRQIFTELAAGNHRALLSRVAEDARWTVTGTCPVSGSYQGRQAFYEQVLSPVTTKLSGRVKPSVVRIFGDGEWVVVEWRGEAQACAGFPYNNSYCWVLRISGDQIAEGIIYSDTALVSRLLAKENG